MTHATHPPESWSSVRRAATAIASPIQRILAAEAASGVVLLAATAIALVWANTWPAAYADVWHAPIGGRIGPWSYEQPLHFWVNDGLMTLFFFVVGLEIRREIFEGELASLKKAALPAAAAIGGMFVPAGIFVALNLGRAGAAGWAVPMATDIAFAVGVLTLLGSRVPPALRFLLLGLAVIDDLGAIVVIAIFYGTGFSPAGLGIAIAGLGAILVMRGAGVRAPIVYVVPGIVVWGGLLMAGLHPTIGGVVVGLLTPIRSWLGPSGFAATTQEQLAMIPMQDRRGLLTSLDSINVARREAVSPTERLIHHLHPWIAFVVMPVFALANAGVALDRASISGDGIWLFAGIVVGLALGKPLGIALAALGAGRAGIAHRVETSGVVLVGMVGGIGFTMSLFMAQLAFPPGPLLDTAKLAVLIGSGIAILAGLTFGLLARHRLRPRQVASEATERGSLNQDREDNDAVGDHEERVALRPVRQGERERDGDAPA